MNVQTKHFDFAGLTESNPSRQQRWHFLDLYRLARSFDAPNILELGTQRGKSTTVFLQACHETGGRLTSVDVQDCSDVSDDPRFCFVQSDSTLASSVIAKAPHLSNGVDLLYVDSVHNRHHVEREIAAWWPHLKQGSIIAFDDVDPHKYRPGQRSDKGSSEFYHQGIADFVEEIFRADLDRIEMTLRLGASGLAVLRKHSPAGEPFVMPPRIRKRGELYRFYRRLRSSGLGRRLRGLVSSK